MTPNTTSKKQDFDLRTYKQLFKALSTALYHDQDRKRYHGFTAALVARKVAENTGLVSAANIFYTGLIHDLGGIGLPHHVVHYELADRDQIKHYPPSELRQVVHHGPVGADMLAKYGVFDWATDIIRDHHERHDGTGFPEGKSGKEITSEVDILGAADMLDMYLCSIEGEHTCNKEKRVRGFKDFLTSHGGFSPVVRDEILTIASREEFIGSLLSVQTLEKMIKRSFQQLTPPGDINVDSIVKLLGAVIDVKSNYTEDHSKRVAQMGDELGRKLGMDEDELQEYKYGAYLHDLGKVGVDRQIIDKPAELTDKEYEKIKKHPLYSKEILSEIDKLDEVAKITGHHHEWYDGNGYPRGLNGEDIHLGARIIAVTDAWDAMTSDRPYRKALSKEKAVDELRDQAGSQFDPKVVDAFLEMLEESSSKEGESLERAS